METRQAEDYGDIEFPLDPIEAEPTEDDDLDQTESSGPEDYVDVPPQLVELESDEAVQAMEPEARIERLFENMFSHRQTLLAIISLCEQTADYDTVGALVRRHQQASQSVYVVDNFLNMLVKAGALERVDADGNPYQNLDIEPREVEQDGQVFLEVVQAPEVFWRTSAAGKAALAANDSVQEIEAIFADHETLREAFGVMLDMCARESGADISELRNAINERSDVMEAKKTAQFLLDYLSNAGALYYDVAYKAWKTSETGTLAIQLLKGKEG